MARYIDAKTAAEIIAQKHNIPLSALVDTFADIPSADVVEVIRCKDCALRKTEDCAMYYECDYCECQHTWESDNDYCSWAERKEDENDRGAI